ncbi:hypothetical protein FN846DRAFT_609831 [Sphaerosporella brunnea]|uniref:Cupredoxin n=1 Tax=Sphaerosporella brunnea TaxID=1250544 RepID=A0A5J5F0P2_9PEZI|nr:hypothetical protein FN846DRAFT_609831 [Sphaerosporella brunnea]
MLRQVTTLLAVMATGVFAQSSGTASATSSAPAATHTIKVGFPIGQHAFSPDSSTANVGDTIVFEMLPQNHSVVHMDPKSPCVPWDVAGNPKSGAWWSGFYPVSDASNPSYFNQVVTTTDPIWFYCSVPGSCIDYQMVGVINPANASDLARVKALAKKANFSLSPGESIPSDGTVPSAAATTKASSSNSGGSSLSSGAIAGIVIGAVGAFALVGLLFFFVGRKKKAQELKSKTEGSDSEAAAAAAAAASHDHPPMYQDPNNPAFTDPRYSMVPGSPPPEQWGGKNGHQSYVAPAGEERNSHRLSELPSQNYDPVEIYTPGPEHHSFPTTQAEEEAGDRQRDTNH